MKYDVHIYATVRYKYVGIQAPSQLAAIGKAKCAFLKSTGSDAETAEYADEITNYLVDQHGDEEHEHSQEYDCNGAPLIDGVAPFDIQAGLWALNKRGGPGGFPLTDLEKQLCEEIAKIGAAIKGLPDPSTGRALDVATAYGEVEDFVENTCDGEDAPAAADPAIAQSAILANATAAAMAHCGVHERTPYCTVTCLHPDPDSGHDYLVTWAIDMDADNPNEAAARALIVQRDVESTATVFDVRDTRTGIVTRVDLSD